MTVSSEGRTCPPDTLFTIGRLSQTETFMNPSTTASSHLLEIPNLTPVNVVSSCKLGIEIDLRAVATANELNEDSRVNSVELSTKSGQRVLVRLASVNSLSILSRKGTCIVTGARSQDELDRSQDLIIDILFENGVLQTRDVNPFQTQNIVYTTELGETVNLNKLLVLLGFENSEYEPEQFPGLVYQPSTESGVVLIFSSGKVVITGVTSKQQGIDILQDLREKM